MYRSALIWTAVVLVSALIAVVLHLNDVEPFGNRVAPVPMDPVVIPTEEDQIRGNGQSNAERLIRRRFTNVSVAEPSRCDALPDFEDEKCWVVFGDLTLNANGSIIGRWKTVLHRDPNRYFSFIEVTYALREDSCTYVVMQRPSKHQRNTALDNSNRTMVVWTLKNKGVAAITADGKTHTIESFDDIPLDSFELSSVEVSEEPLELAEMIVLDALTGKWDSELVFGLGKWEPHDCTLTGFEKTEWVCNGRFQRSISAAPANASHTVLVTTYDTKDKVYRAWSFLERGTIDEFTGLWDEATKTMKWSLIDQGEEEIEGVDCLADHDQITGSWKITGEDGTVLTDMTFNKRRQSDPRPK